MNPRVKLCRALPHHVANPAVNASSMVHTSCRSPMYHELGCADPRLGNPDGFDTQHATRFESDQISQPQRECMNNTMRNWAALRAIPCNINRQQRAVTVWHLLGDWINQTPWWSKYDNSRGVALSIFPAVNLPFSGRAFCHLPPPATTISGTYGSLFSSYVICR